MPDNSEINRSAPPESYAPKTPEERADEWIEGIKIEIERIKKLEEKNKNIDTAKAIRGFVAKELFQDSLGQLLRSMAIAKTKKLTEGDKKGIVENWEETWLCLKKGLDEFGNFIPPSSRDDLKSVLESNQKFTERIMRRDETAFGEVSGKGKRMSNFIKYRLFLNPSSTKSDINYYVKKVEKSLS